MLRRAVRRGALPDGLDTDLVQDVWAGTILYRRLMTGSPSTPTSRNTSSTLLLTSPRGTLAAERAASRGSRCHRVHGVLRP
ncbi:TetR-like C-terminal domain-containing protein [Streptomyces sp. NPDC101234]|uniref:TetR-like C-terminal domain-containing protein n=1 Tax=Streptomyces sp. NPDC101234 TaxID=3366138 RepID=UPI00381FB319